MGLIVQKFGGTSVANTWTSGGTTYGTDAIVIATKTGNNYVASYVVLVSDKFNNAGSGDGYAFVHRGADFLRPLRHGH